MLFAILAQGCNRPAVESIIEIQQNHANVLILKYTRYISESILDSGIIWLEVSISIVSVNNLFTTTSTFTKSGNI